MWRAAFSSASARASSLLPISVCKTTISPALFGEDHAVAQFGSVHHGRLLRYQPAEAHHPIRKPPTAQAI
jgi:hypothetical protein